MTMFPNIFETTVYSQQLLVDLLPHWQRAPADLLVVTRNSIQVAASGVHYRDQYTTPIMAECLHCLNVSFYAVSTSTTGVAVV